MDDITDSEIKKFMDYLENLIHEKPIRQFAIETLKREIKYCEAHMILFGAHPFIEMYRTIIKRNKLTEPQDLADEVQKKLDAGQNKQDIIKELYSDSWDKKSQQRHGVVYTPNEIVEFINNSVQHILKTEFNTDMSQVKVIDPFAGTGVFGESAVRHGAKDIECYEIDPVTAKVCKANVPSAKVICKDTLKEKTDASL